MDTTKKLNLAKAQKVKAESDLKAKAGAAEKRDEERLQSFQRVIGELSEVVRRGVVVEGLESLSDASDRIEEFGETVKGLMRDVAVQLGHINELEIPSSLVVETIADKSVVEALQQIGDNGELISKIQKLDEALVLLSVTLKEAQVQGKRPEDYIPVRIVRGIDTALTFITDLPFGGFTGSTSSSSLSKPTDAYSIGPISETATHKYFFFEDADLNYYIMRKTLATNMFEYTKGTGGCMSVYVDSTSDPSGSPTFASYGNTF